MFKTKKIQNFKYKLNKIVNKLLLAGDKFIPELHLRQPQVTYLLIALVDRLQNIEERIPKIKDTGDLNSI